MTELKPKPKKYWSRDIPEGRWEYIVIGSGIGGMTAAAMLSKMGKRVLVLEQHYVPGGFTQTFKRPGYRWDVGVHLVGEMTERSYPGRLLSDLTDGRLRWESVGEVYDEFNFPDGFTIQLPNSKPAFRQTLIEYFPDEVDAIDRYLREVRAAARSTASYMNSRAVPRLMGGVVGRRSLRSASPYVQMTTAEFLEDLTDDPRLRAVLAAQWGYYGSTPSKSSFAMHALMVAHFLWGAYYPVGGAGAIATEMLRTVADGGGWTAIRQPVTRIEIDGGKVVGVRLKDDRLVESSNVISAAGAVPTAGLVENASMLPDSSRKMGPAHLSLYLGFEGDITKAGAAGYSQWFYDSWSMERDRWDVVPGVMMATAPVLYCSFPSLKDPSHQPGPGLRHTGEVITFVDWEGFAPWEGTKWKRRGHEYDRFKVSLTESLQAQYLERYPALAPMVTYSELSTPLSTHHFARSHQGSIYGLASEPGRFVDKALSPRTPIKGMYLAGADVMAPGVVGGLGGGALAVSAAEPGLAARYLRPIMKRSPA